MSLGTQSRGLKGIWIPEYLVEQSPAWNILPHEFAREKNSLVPQTTILQSLRSQHPYLPSSGTVHAHQDMRTKLQWHSHTLTQNADHLLLTFIILTPKSHRGGYPGCGHSAAFCWRCALCIYRTTILRQEGLRRWQLYTSQGVSLAGLSVSSHYQCPQSPLLREHVLGRHSGLWIHTTALCAPEA